MSKPTVDLDALAGRTIGPRHQECAVGFALRVLDAETADKFRRALVNENVRHNELEYAFRDYGHTVPQFAVGRHRRGGCKCEPEA